MKKARERFPNRQSQEQGRQEAGNVQLPRERGCCVLDVELHHEELQRRVENRQPEPDRAGVSASAAREVDEEAPDPQQNRWHKGAGRDSPGPGEPAAKELHSLTIVTCGLKKRGVRRVVCGRLTNRALLWTGWGSPSYISLSSTAKQTTARGVRATIVVIAAGRSGAN